MRSKKRLSPSPSMARHILGGHVTLDELFVINREEQEPGKFLAHMRRRARYKVVQAFMDALDECWLVSDNYIVNCGPELDDLARFVAKATKNGRRLVKRTDLPPVYQALDDKWVDMVCAQAGGLLLREELVALLTGEDAYIWYHSRSRVWQARQSLMDQYDELRREAYGYQPPRHRRRFKRDNRSYHGRPKRDRRRNRGLGVAPGVSVGMH